MANRRRQPPGATSGRKVAVVTTARALATPEARTLLKGRCLLILPIAKSKAGAYDQFNRSFLCQAFGIFVNMKRSME